MVVKTTGSNGNWQRWVLTILLTAIFGLVGVGYSSIKDDMQNNRESLKADIDANRSTIAKRAETTDSILDSLKIYLIREHIVDSVIRADLRAIKLKIGVVP